MWFLWFMVACGGGPAMEDGVQPGALPPAADTAALDAASSAVSYTPCVTDASCGPGEACTTVPGFAGAYCAPACDPNAPQAEQDAACGVLDGVDAYCMESGRCARSCGEPDSCPDGLECQTAEPLGEVCAGEEQGGSGFYGTCSHPMTAGPDCPPESECFGGSLLGIDNGLCLPWCDTGECPEVPDGLADVSPLCFDTTDFGFDHPLCVLLCQPDSAICPEGQECLDYGGFGLCAPEGFSF